MIDGEKTDDDHLEERKRREREKEGEIEGGGRSTET